ncbi:MAG: hypothetical protein JKY24_04595 [Pseudomonadales bacterium]|nr:hypothetical protein [Pseudomonadales bacterium]
MNKKGIVLSPSFKPLPGGGLQCGGDSSPLELRKYLMYWDEIDYPSNSLIHVSSPDIDFLETTNSLKRTKVFFQGYVNSGNGEFFIAAQESALMENQKTEPGSWTLAQLSGVPFYSQAQAGIAVDFELYGMLPVPSENTPLADILEFKEQRPDEIIALRTYLDEIYQKIISSADIPRANNTEISKLEIAIKDLNKALNESVINQTVSSIRNIINLDFTEILSLGIGAAGLTSLIPMSPLLAGMAGAGIAVGLKYINMPNSEKCPSQFNYLNSVRKNFQVE